MNFTERLGIVPHFAERFTEDRCFLVLEHCKVLADSASEGDIVILHVPLRLVLFDHYFRSPPRPMSGQCEIDKYADDCSAYCSCGNGYEYLEQDEVP